MSRVLWFHPRPVLPPRGGGQVRTLGLMSSAVQAGHQIMLVQPAGDAGLEGPDGVQLTALTVRRGMVGMVAKIASRCPLRSPRVTRSSLAAARREVHHFGPEVAVLSDVLGWSIASPLLPDIPWVYDAHNVETDLYRSLRDDAVGLFDRVTFGVDYRRMVAIERRATAASSALVTVSHEDAVGLAALAPVRRSVVVPSSVPTPVEATRPAGADRVVLFVGSLDYPPNVAALEELVTAVMPAVRECCPDARLVVVGRRPSRRLRELLGGQSWIALREDVADLAPCYREARCVILPIRSGSGSRLKVYEALSYGVPLVATDVAVGGVPLVPGRDVQVGATAEDLARDAVAVLTDDDLARRLGAAGRATFVRSLAWSRVSEPMTTLLTELADGAS